MPYIKVSERARAFIKPMTPGELNYKLSVVVDEYLKEREPAYAHISEVIGALECAKLELYRRIAAPYEDGKRAENGDVYRCLR